MSTHSDKHQPVEDSASDVSASGQTGPAVMSDKQLDEAKRYGREDLICDLADRLLDIAYLGVMALVVAYALDGWMREHLMLENMWVRLAGMFLIVTAGHIGVSFPLSLYSGYMLEHKYGMSNQSFGRWLWQYAKRNLLTLVFGLAMIEGLYGVIWLTGNVWWLAASAAFFVVSIVLGQLTPVLILPLFYKIEKMEDELLAQRFAALTDGTGLSIQGVYRMELSNETVKANAMLAGLGATRRVILGDTLLNEFSGDEIEVVFAHEVGHHVHRHIRKMVLLGMVYSVAGFLVCHWLVAAWVGDPNWALRSGSSSLPVYVLPLLMWIITLCSLVLEPLRNAISRHFERQCDRYALQRTGNPDAYRSAFTKLAAQNKSDPDPHPAEVFFLHSHPPISQRLAMADEGLSP